MKVKLLAGLGFVAVTTLVGLLYKVSQATSGGFRYSTMSAIAIAEMVKLTMSTGFHVADGTYHIDGKGRVLTAWSSARDQLSSSAILHIWFLAALYSTNNQLSFYVYTLADPGTIYLFKAASTLIVATIQCTFVGKVFTIEQWKAMFLQGVGMIIVQYNPCKGSTRYEPTAYVLMAVSAGLSATCAVRNEYLVKNYKICLNVQNAVLYSGGVWMNILAFFLVPNPNSKQAEIGFFKGYDNPLAIGVVLVNALIGIAITAVYKYADAVTKCIATDMTAVLLCILSSIFFELQASVTMWCGVVVVCFAVHHYTSAAPAPPAPAPAAALAGTRPEVVGKAMEANGAAEPSTGMGGLHKAGPSNSMELAEVSGPAPSARETEKLMQ